MIESEINNLKVGKYMSELIESEIAAYNIEKLSNANLLIEHSMYKNDLGG
jgi:hypothetical protein